MGLKFNPTTGQLDLAGGDFVKRSGDTMTGALGIGVGTPRSTYVLDIISSDTGTIDNVASGSLAFHYTGGGYYNEGLYFEFKVYAYRIFNSIRVYSTTPYTISGTDNNLSDGNYNISLSWGSVVGADGYRIVVVSDSYAGASNDQYFDIGGTSARIGLANPGYVEEIAAYYSYAATPTVTPTTTPSGADFYLDKTGDLHSTGNFYFNNYPSLSLGNDNGLQLSGNYAKVLTLPTTSYVNLGGISLKAGRVPTGNHIVFPQGYGGSTSPGIRFEGGQTDGGLAMDDGILEFWNNFSRYVTPVSGRLQAVFRIDTRSGYESEGFIIGGSMTTGTGFVGIGMNFGNGDVNFNYYGYGATGIGRDTGTLGISAKNGWLGVYKTIKGGGGLILGYVAKTANYTITEDDHTINCTANSFTITLPSAATWTGQIYNIKNSGTGVITIATTSSQTIDGNASGVLTLAQYDNLTVQSNGSNWIIL